MDEEDCPADGKELGYQYLNTSFSGTTSPQLSGNAEWVFPCTDRGTAAPLGDMEIG